MESELLEAHRGLLREYLEREGQPVNYVERIRQCIADKNFRLIIDVNDLRSFDESIANSLLRTPRLYVVALQDVVNEIAPTLDPTASKVLANTEIQIGFDGSFGANSVSPRGLLSSQLNRLVEVEGIVTKCSNVKPKIVKSVSYCPKTKNYQTKEFRDHTALNLAGDGNNAKMPTNAAIPTQDIDGNSLETEHGLSQYKDYQCVTIQEMPERAKVGQLPRSVEVMLEYDLVDRVKPGDRVQCVGIYRPLVGNLQGPSANVASGIFRSVLLCNNVKVIGKEVGAIKLTGEDIANIRQLSQRPDLLQVVSRSLCPSIFGHNYIKTALILQLLGGVEHNLPNGIHLRGDINMMLIGDPSTAKSQLLRTILDIAPLAISTSGRGSSGVGLTAAVTADPETGERKLEAGAMVLADRGIVCIDEFDKMSEVDRVAIHEVMEQQTVTIAKAGIHAALNARCSVLAAANPIYGQYDRNRRPQENIGLPDSLLSRFDLLFIVLDQFDSGFDRKLSEHVIKSHQYRRPGTTCEPEPLVQSTSSLRLEYATAAANNSANNGGGSGDSEVTPVWQRGGAREASAAAGSSSSSSSSSGGMSGATSDLLTKEFLRKYIHYARNKAAAPTLTDEAMDHISSNYANMRAQVQSRGNLPVTARSLETMIRLSAAHAKLRLSPSIDLIDVEAALVLVNFVLFHEISGNGEMDQEAETGNSGRSQQQNKENHVNNSSSSASASTLVGKRKNDSVGAETDDSEGVDDELGSKRSRPTVAAAMSRESVISVILANRNEDEENETGFPKQILEREMGLEDASLSSTEREQRLAQYNAIIEDLCASNKIMVTDDTIIPF